MMKAAATSFHCIDGGLDKNGTSVGLVVAAAPTVKCFQGPHLQLSIALVMLIPPFLFMLLPYAVVNGDAHYVASSCLFEYKFWETMGCSCGSACLQKLQRIGIQEAGS